MGRSNRESGQVPDLKPMPVSPSRRPPYEHLCCYLLLAGALLLAVLFPGDVAWINDEPKLIHNALAANDAGSLATHGLKGTQGVSYGPLPTWIYQVYLLVSRDLLLLVQIRAALFMLVIAACLARLASLTGLGMQAVPVFLLSPYLWFYSRQIWDNTFSIPLALIAIVAYLEFLAGRKWAVTVCVVACGALLLTHLMGIPLVAAIGLHLIFIARKKIRPAALHALAGAAIAILPVAQYFLSILPKFREAKRGRIPDIADLTFSLSGGQWFSLAGWKQLLGREWWSAAPAPLRALATTSLVAHLFILGGLALLVLALARREDWPSERKAFGIICLATIGIQWLYFGMGNVTGEIHYYNATWPAYAGLIWIALNWISTWRPTRYVPIIWATMLLLSIGALALRLHNTNGTRSFGYGPTMRNQIDVVRTLTDLGPNCTITLAAPALQKYPHRLDTLCELYGSTSPQSDAPVTATVNYSGDDWSDGGIVVVVEQIPVSASSPTSR